MAERQSQRAIETLHGLVERVEEGDEFEVYAGEFIVDEVIECEARPMLRVRKKSVGGWMQRTYRLEWEDPTDEDDETLVIKTKYKSHWSEWSTFAPERVDLEDEPEEIATTAEENEPVLMTDGGVEQSTDALYRVNGHEFETVKDFDEHGEIVRCRECLIREAIDEDDDPNETLDLQTTDCHIQWLRQPDGGFHGVAIRNSNYFRGRQLIGVKEEDGDLEVADTIRIYDDDAPQLASLLDKEVWDEVSTNER